MHTTGLIHIPHTRTRTPHTHARAHTTRMCAHTPHTPHIYTYARTHTITNTQIHILHTYKAYTPPTDIHNDTRTSNTTHTHHTCTPHQIAEKKSIPFCIKHTNGNANPKCDPTLPS